MGLSLTASLAAIPTRNTVLAVFHLFFFFCLFVGFCFVLFLGAGSLSVALSTARSAKVMRVHSGTGRVQVWTLCWSMFMCPHYLQRHTDNAPAAEQTSNLICFNIGFIINSVMGTSKSQHATGLKHTGWTTIYVSTPCRIVCHLDLMTM